MYDFTSQKELLKYCDTIRDICSRVEEEDRYGTPFTIMDCYNEIKAKVFYVEGEAVAYYDGWEEELHVLREKINIDMLEGIMEYIDARIYAYFENDAEIFNSDLNKMLVLHGCVEEESLSIEEQEEVDLKEWQQELAGQAYACNKGIL